MNLFFVDQYFLLAQDAQGPQGFGGLGFLLITLMLVFYLLVLRPQRREQQTRQTMLTQLKKNDRVVTVGGIYGVVANVRPEADEVTLKVDESSNTRLKITLGSISRVITDQPAGSAKSESGTGASLGGD